jgi:hypothetical protein
MKRRGFAGGPFQLLIGIVVFGMAIVIATYLFNMINCWKCEELMKIEAVELKEAIASVGKGDTHSRKNDVIEMQGHCADGIYLNRIEAGGNIKCRSFCPNHPNSCWVIIANSRCSGGTIMRECIDISGDAVIEYDSNVGVNPTSTDPNPDQWVTGPDARAFLATTTPIKVEKTGPNTILIGKP